MVDIEDVEITDGEEEVPMSEEQGGSGGGGGGGISSYSSVHSSALSMLCI